MEESHSLRTASSSLGSLSSRPAARLLGLGGRSERVRLFHSLWNQLDQMCQYDECAELMPDKGDAFKAAFAAKVQHGQARRPLAMRRQSVEDRLKKLAKRRDELEVAIGEKRASIVAAHRELRTMQATLQETKDAMEAMETDVFYLEQEGADAKVAQEQQENESQAALRDLRSEVEMLRAQLAVVPPPKSKGKGTPAQPPADAGGAVLALGEGAAAGASAAGAASGGGSDHAYLAGQSGYVAAVQREVFNQLSVQPGGPPPEVARPARSTRSDESGGEPTAKVRALCSGAEVTSAEARQEPGNFEELAAAAEAWEQEMQEAQLLQLQLAQEVAGNNAGGADEAVVPMAQDQPGAPAPGADGGRGCA